MSGIDDFLKEAEQEALKAPKSVRDVQLERIRGMWETYKGDDRIISSHELMELMENEPAVPKVSSPWPKLDELTGGLRYGQLVVLTAQEKTGKTTFALQMIQTVREPTCFLFEQNPKEIIRQMKERGQEVPYFLTPAINVENTWAWIEKRAMEAMVKRGSRVFVIDNVDWLQKEYGYNQRTDEVMRDLLLKIKSFCKLWDVIVILVAHVVKVPFEQIPQPDNIKDTGAFKQIADTVLILWRKTVQEKVDGTKTKAAMRTSDTLLWVAENRAVGKTGYIQLGFDGKTFSEKVWDVSLESADNFNNMDYAPKL